MSPLQYQIYLGGAEIPCTPEEEATGAPLCDRDAVLSEIRENFGDFAAGLPIGLMLGCGQRLEDFLADTDGVVTSTCDHRITNPGQVVSLWSHMHEFGSSYRMTLDPGTSEERVLLDIPTWSFEWQFGYVPENVFVVDDDDCFQRQHNVSSLCVGGLRLRLGELLCIQDRRHVWHQLIDDVRWLRDIGGSARLKRDTGA